MITQASISEIQQSDFFATAHAVTAWGTPKFKEKPFRTTESGSEQASEP
ncbi:MAG TPA: hypothetical protein VGD98_04795 [Ktedonobacteraceae bacterium]